MPKKPARPLASLVFPKSGPPWLKLHSLPTDKDKLELEIANRFVSALKNAAGENYRCEGHASEPGDVLLRADNGDSICLQIGEAVDAHRIKTTQRRNEYASQVWKGNVELRSSYRGVQVALIDGGEARDLPRISSKDGQRVLGGLARNLRELIPIVGSLPSNDEGQFRGKATRLDVLSVPMVLHVRLLRYGPPVEKNPAKCLWTGAHPIREGDALERFTEVVTNKASQYGNIDSRFWLMVYSLDSYCEPHTENSLSNTLKQIEHPFERVYLFSPQGLTGEVRELFPNRSESVRRPTGDMKKVLIRLLPEDAMPRWDDPRWKSVEDD
jgi:hypothetical protein